MMGYLLDGADGLDDETGGDKPYCSRGFDQELSDEFVIDLAEKPVALGGVLQVGRDYPEIVGNVFVFALTPQHHCEKVQHREGEAVLTFDKTDVMDES